MSIKNKKMTKNWESIVLNLLFYLVLFIIGVILIISGALKFRTTGEILENAIIVHSIGVAFLTMSVGFFFFLVYVFFEYGKTYQKVIFNIIGIVTMVELTIYHVIFDNIVGLLNVNTLFLGVPNEYVLPVGAASMAYIYVLVVRRVFKACKNSLISRKGIFIIHILLPLACFLITTLFMFIGIGWLILMWVLYLLVNVIGSVKNKGGGNKNGYYEDNNAASCIVKNNEKMMERM